MRQSSQRAAAYTRTSILRRFLDQFSHSPVDRVDNDYAEQRLGLKGGDIRAFLQSLRVLGLTDPYGQTTERARRMRGVTQRAGAMKEALQDAYPELYYKWEGQGGMQRDEVEDFFKVEYGLSTSSAGPAAKLFSDLMREYAQAEPVRSMEWQTARSAIIDEGFAVAGEVAPAERAPVAAVPPEDAAPRGAVAPAAAPITDVRVAALEAIKSSVRIDINAEWDEERIGLVFDRMERLLRLAVEGGTDDRAGVRR